MNSLGEDIKATLEAQRQQTALVDLAWKLPYVPVVRKQEFRYPHVRLEGELPDLAFQGATILDIYTVEVIALPLRARDQVYPAWLEAAMAATKERMGEFRWRRKLGKDAPADVMTYAAPLDDPEIAAFLYGQYPNAASLEVKPGATQATHIWLDDWDHLVVAPVANEEGEFER